jgi:ABC-2 type transport system permease protein
VLLYLGGAWLIFGISFHLESFPVLAVGVVLTLLSSVGLGMLSASFILYFKRGDPINFFLSGMTTLFGSVFFPVEQLPQALQGVSDYLPITWSLRVVRGALLQGKGFGDLQSDLAALAVLTVVLLPAGLYFSRIAIRKAKREGSLVQY